MDMEQQHFDQLLDFDYDYQQEQGQLLDSLHEITHLLFTVQKINLILKSNYLRKYVNYLSLVMQQLVDYSGRDNYLDLVTAVTNFAEAMCKHREDHVLGLVEQLLMLLLKSFQSSLFSPLAGFFAQLYDYYESYKMLLGYQNQIFNLICIQLEESYSDELLALFMQIVTDEFIDEVGANLVTKQIVRIQSLFGSSSPSALSVKCYVCLISIAAMSPSTELFKIEIEAIYAFIEHNLGEDDFQVVFEPLLEMTIQMHRFEMISAENVQTITGTMQRVCQLCINKNTGLNNVALRYIEELHLDLDERMMQFILEQISSVQAKNVILALKICYDFGQELHSLSLLKERGVIYRLVNVLRQYTDINVNESDNLVYAGIELLEALARFCPRELAEENIADIFENIQEKYDSEKIRDKAETVRILVDTDADN